MVQMTIDAGPWIEKAKQDLANVKNGAQIATANSSQRALAAARTAGVKMMRSTYTVKSAAAKSHMIIRHGRDAYMRELVITGSPIRVEEFKHSKRAEGAFVSVKNGGGGVIKSSFFTVGRHGVGVFVRTTPERLPIQEQYGPSVPQMMGNPTVVDAMQKRGAEVFEERMAHEISRLGG